MPPTSATYGVVTIQLTIKQVTFGQFVLQVIIVTGQKLMISVYKILITSISNATCDLTALYFTNVIVVNDIIFLLPGTN